jgi:hypothetical protein
MLGGWVGARDGSGLTPPNGKHRLTTPRATGNHVTFGAPDLEVNLTGTFFFDDLHTSPILRRVIFDLSILCYKGVALVRRDQIVIW